VGEGEGAAGGGGLDGSDDHAVAVAAQAGVDGDRWGSGLEVDAVPGQGGGFSGAQAEEEGKGDQGVQPVTLRGDQQRTRLVCRQPAAGRRGPALGLDRGRGVAQEDAAAFGERQDPLRQVQRQAHGAGGVPLRRHALQDGFDVVRAQVGDLLLPEAGSEVGVDQRLVVRPRGRCRLGRQALLQPLIRQRAEGEGALVDGLSGLARGAQLVELRTDLGAGAPEDLRAAAPPVGVGAEVELADPSILRLVVEDRPFAALTSLSGCHRSTPPAVGSRGAGEPKHRIAGWAKVDTGGRRWRPDLG